MHTREVDELAGLLKAISHPIRLKILCLLQDSELSVSSIREEVKTTNANISQHLNILRNQGIIDFRRDANFIYNRISDRRIIELIKTLQHLFCTGEPSGNHRQQHGRATPGGH
ncbi:MAG TPA: ArsR family transcriptional regulator [Desulfobulbus sp.]|nr:ArsR family transcriptional regulator [Desulfobulbus sp.]